MANGLIMRSRAGSLLPPLPLRYWNQQRCVIAVSVGCRLFFLRSALDSFSIAEEEFYDLGRRCRFHQQRRLLWPSGLEPPSSPGLPWGLALLSPCICDWLFASEQVQECIVEPLLAAVLYQLAVAMFLIPALILQRLIPPVVMFGYLAPPSSQPSYTPYIFPIPSVLSPLLVCD